MTHELATGENFDIVRGNQTVRVPFAATNPQTAETDTLAIAAQTPTAGHLAALDANGNPTDGGCTAGELARYALPATAITPTAGAPFVLADCFPIVYTPNGGSSVTIAATDADDLTIESFSEETMEGPDEGFKVKYNGTFVFETTTNGVFDVAYGFATITFNGNAPTEGTTPALGFTPTYELADRTMNQVVVASPLPENGIALKFPDAQTGKVRDFVVRLTLTETNDVVPSVTFPADVAYETEGGEWPDLTEAGTYIVRLTEVPTASESETARFFLQCSSAVSDAEPPSAGGAA